MRNALGAGGFGAVYLGHDTQLDRPVAIKVLRGGPDVPQAEAERFLQEARRLARLSHPGIVAVHDVGVDEGQVYIVSDYLDGPDLGRWLRDNRPAWPEAARIAAAVADALAHAHARLIVHRDVKPANIILTPDRGPVLVDFGLGLDEARAGGRELGVISGTPAYMAPEQVAGTAHRIDGRTDIYSLGVVLYEMLAAACRSGRATSGSCCGRCATTSRSPRGSSSATSRPSWNGPASRRWRSGCRTATPPRRTSPRTCAASSRRPAEAPASRQPPVETPTGEPLAAPPASSRPDALTPPSSRRRAREAERRQVTVLVCGCDLFESEAYLEDLDAEDQAEVLRAFQQACEQAVRRFDGTVVQCNEQGLLVCFGYPVAYEDAARRAARTGLGILEDMKALGEQLRREHKLELNPWVGIHTGPAVVEAGEDAVSLVGEARNVAVRLEDVAEPGQIVMHRGHPPVDPGPVSTAPASATARSRGWRSPSSSSRCRESARPAAPSRRRGRPGSRR